MNFSAKFAIGAVIGLIVLGAIAVVGINSQRSATDGSTSPNTQPNLNAIREDDVAMVITYTGTGFEPNNASVEANNEIRIRNRSSRMLKFVSDPYLDQSDNPEFNVGELKPGESRKFYVSQMGRWGYHNALDPSETGLLIVR